MPSLLVIHPSPTAATRSLLELVLAGAYGYLLGTPAWFRNLAGRERQGLLR